MIYRYKYPTIIVGFSILQRTVYSKKTIITIGEI